MDLLKNIDQEKPVKKERLIDRITIPNIAYFLIIFVALSLVAVYLLSNNYVNDVSLGRWTKLISILEADNFRLENLGLIYPHLPIYILVPFYYLPGLGEAAAPTVVTILITAGFLTWWNHSLRDKGYGFLFRMGITLLTILHPFFLWSITTGLTQNAISLVIFALMLYSFVTLAHDQDARAFLFLGVLLAVYFFIDERSIFIFIAMLPLLPILAIGRILRESPPSVYIVVMFPAFISIISWLYLSFTFSSDPWQFLDARDSSFRGGWYNTPAIGWLVAYGGEMLRPVIVTAAMGFLSYPVIAWLIFKSKSDSAMRRCAGVLFLLPVIAVSLATSGYYSPHPSDFLFLYSAGVLGLLGTMPKVRSLNRSAIIILMMVGTVGGWFCMSMYPSGEIKQWQAALVGEKPPVTHEADLAVGVWLRQNRAATLIDDRSGFRVIAARGDSKGLVLPFTNGFKLELRREFPTITQIVVPKPGSDMGGFDRINQHFYALYYEGAPGYSLVFDHDGWRVYRKNS